MGVWMAQVGRDYKAAYSQFEKALDAKTYPGAEREAPTEHIHTSMAAAVVQLVKSGDQGRVTGLEVVRGHLRQASSATFFNPHTSHVAANLLFDMSRRNGVFQQDQVGLGATSVRARLPTVTSASLLMVRRHCSIVPTMTNGCSRELWELI
jgi:hypothetical protein